MTTQEKWELPENKKILKALLKQFGEFKIIEIPHEGKIRRFKVSTKKIIIEGIKAQALLRGEYGKELFLN